MGVDGTMKPRERDGDVGRLVRRVPLDFDWPLNVVWRGYVRPGELDPHRYPVCAIPPDSGGDRSAPEPRESARAFHPCHIDPEVGTGALDVSCAVCGGEGHLGTSGQVAAYEGWRETDPPAGEGWQLWETTSEGSPISPVFPTADGLIAWLSHPDRGQQWLPAVVAANFVVEGSAPSFVGSSTSGEGMAGAEYMGFHAELPDDEELSE